MANLKELKDTLKESIEKAISGFINFETNFDDVGIIYLEIKLCQENDTHYESDAINVTIVPTEENYTIDQIEFENIVSPHECKDNIFKRRIF